MVWWFLLKHKVVVDWSINEIKENPAPPFLSSHWDGVIGFHLIIFIHSTHHLQTFLVLPCSLSTILNLSAHLCSTPLLSPMFIYIWLMNYSILSIFSCFQGNFQFIMLTWSKKRFGNFKIKPIKHYWSDKRKLGWKKHNFDLAKSNFYPPEGHSCKYQNLGTLKWAYYFRSCQKEENFMWPKFGRVLPVIRNIHFYDYFAECEIGV